MDENEWLAERFEEHRAHLQAVAYRMLGSLAEADDAVQDAWLRLSRAGADEVENLRAWLTTIVAAQTFATALSRFQVSAAESDLVSVGIAVRDLAHAVGVGFPLHRVESPIGYLRNERVEVIDEAQVHGMASVLWPQHNVHIPMRSELPHGLCVVRKE
jgi:DNA-directed RNA polymerase specialized sigma24 family protein